MTARKTALGAWLRVAERLLGWVSHAAAALGALLVIVMTGVIGYSVALRYLFNQPQTWTDELVGYLLVVVVMLGAAEALRRGDHIAVDLLTERLGPRGRRRCEAWGLLAVCFVAAVLVAGGWEMVSFSADVGLISDGYLEVPMWIPQAAVPVGSALLLLVALERLARLLLGLDGTPGKR